MSYGDSWLDKFLYGSDSDDDEMIQILAFTRAREKIVTQVGAESDDDKVELLLSGVKGKDINELIAAGREKLASVPSGGGAGIAVASAGPAAGGAAAAPAAAEAKKEEKVEEKEESDDDMGFSLFD